MIGFIVFDIRLFVMMITVLDCSPIFQADKSCIMHVYYNTYLLTAYDFCITILCAFLELIHEDAKILNLRLKI